MIFEAALQTFLLGSEPVTALVRDRVFGLLREPSSLLPALLAQRITTQRQTTFCRTSKLVSADFQLDSYAMTGVDAWGLAAAVRSLMIDFEGMMGDIFVNKILLTNEFPTVDGDPGVIRITQLYNIWYVED